MADKLMIGRRTVFVKGGLAASALAALAGCGKKSTSSSDSSDSAATGGTFKYYIGNPVAIDPYNAQESEGTQVEHILFDALTDYDWDKEEVVPKAAKSWDVSDDGLTYTFHLVEGAKFHNGDTVDAKSFKRGWERIANPKMATPSDINYHLAPIEGYDEMNSGDATEISGLTCPDDNTFVVKLKYPMADWPYVCAHPALAPVPQAALDDPDSFLVAPIGNGPFRMDGTWVSDRSDTSTSRSSMTTTAPRPTSTPSTSPSRRTRTPHTASSRRATLISARFPLAASRRSRATRARPRTATP